jgi:hypothetical protein
MIPRNTRAKIIKSINLAQYWACHTFFCSMSLALGQS